MSKIFCVPILSAMVHNEKTEEILKPHRNGRKQSEFIREAILDFAFDRDYMYGMNVIIDNKKPDYVTSTVWQKILLAHQKTHYIKFGYVVAFYWLLSLPEFKGYNKSELMREIIINQSNPQ